MSSLQAGKVTVKSIENPEPVHSVEPDQTPVRARESACTGSDYDERTSEDAELEKTFQTLAAKWKADRGHIASINKIVRLPAYRAIVSLRARG